MRIPQKRSLVLFERQKITHSFLGNKTLSSIFLVLILSFCTPNVNAQSSKTLLFVGTYTDAKPSNGIYIFEFDTSNGNLLLLSTGNDIVNPSFLTLSPYGDYLYACTESKMPGLGSVSAFKVDSTKGSITFINKQNSGGENPVYVSTSKHNEYVICANYTGGTIAAFPTRTDGGIHPYNQAISIQGGSINPRRQDKAHPHAAVFAPEFDNVFFPDLGSDKIRNYLFNSTAIAPLSSIDTLDVLTTPGSGPRHLEFHPNHKFAYCIEELSGTIMAYRYEKGILDSLQRIFSYSKVQKEYNSADIHISPDGLFLYASNRWDNENTISIFAIDTLTGKLMLKGHQPTHGDHPRSFTIDPSGNFLLVANQVTNNIVVFHRDERTGLLMKIGKETHVPNPSSLKMRKYEASLD